MHSAFLETLHSYVLFFILTHVPGLYISFPRIRLENCTARNETPVAYTVWARLKRGSRTQFVFLESWNVAPLGVSTGESHLLAPPEKNELNISPHRAAAARAG